MKNLDRNKKVFLLLSMYILILFSPKKVNRDYDIRCNSDYCITSDEPYARYKDGSIYIGDIEYIKSIVDSNSNDIYIIDDRKSLNPDMAICDSHKIRDKKFMNEIIDLLLEYEKENPSNWNRTKESMINEWIMHNISYDLDFKRESTERVDLDNKDEKKYSLTLFR